MEFLLKFFIPQEIYPIIEKESIKTKKFKDELECVRRKSKRKMKETDQNRGKDKIPAGEAAWMRNINKSMEKNQGK